MGVIEQRHLLVGNALVIGGKRRVWFWRDKNVGDVGGRIKRELTMRKSGGGQVGEDKLRQQMDK